MTDGLFAEIVTNLDVVIECALLLGFSLHMVTGAAIIGWQLRDAEGRQAARACLTTSGFSSFNDAGHEARRLGYWR